MASCKEGAPGRRKPSKQEAQWISKKVYTPEQGYQVPAVLPPPDSTQWKVSVRCLVHFQLQPPYDIIAAPPCCTPLQFYGCLMPHPRPCLCCTPPCQFTAA